MYIVITILHYTLIFMVKRVEKTIGLHHFLVDSLLKNYIFLLCINI